MASFTSSVPAAGNPGLVPRAGILAALFAAELVAICFSFDSALADDAFRHVSAAILRGVVAFAVLLACIAYAQAGDDVDAPLRRISARCSGSPIAFRLLLAHFASIGVFALLSARLFPHHPVELRTAILVSAWLAAGVAAIAMAAFAFAPPGLWREAFRCTGNGWIAALSAGALASMLGIASQWLWDRAASLTFVLVRAVLGLFTTGITADVANRVIGTHSFVVAIAPRCSGLEGAGLMVVTGSLWLWLFRREFRFPRALVVIPFGIGALYLLNVLRISILILIGNAGAPGIAAHGFHSQAGWIVFNGVAVCLLVAAPRVPWLAVKEIDSAPREKAAAGSIQSAVSNNAFLVPLLTILVVAMLSRAASAQFEWLYPIRFIAAAIALWHYRSEYARLDWRFNGTSLFIGTAAFVVWLALDLWLGNRGNSGIGVSEISATLAAAPRAARISWIAIRALAAVVTVPIAEELAFRGFLLRRMQSTLPGMNTLAVIVSSLAFGLLHGERWLAGTIAGLIYAVACLRRGRISDAVIAHATTNALLAGYVIIWSRWSFW